MVRKSLFLVSTVLVFGVFGVAFGGSGFEKEKFDFGWKHIVGDPIGAEQVNFDDSGWKNVDVPHDWSIEGPYVHLGDKEVPPRKKYLQSAHGELDSVPWNWTMDEAYGAYLPNNIGWYRKHFRLGKEYKGKKLHIEFEGVFRDSQVWLNGHLVGKNESGYTGFVVDLQDHAKIGGDNVLAVRVDGRAVQGWWYEGCGIYRHVWLMSDNKLRVAPWGTFVTTPKLGWVKNLEVDTEKIEVNIDMTFPIYTFKKHNFLLQHQ